VSDFDEPELGWGGRDRVERDAAGPSDVLDWPAAAE
jgi:hypothetical protein